MFNIRIAITLAFAPFALGDEAYTCDTFANIYEDGMLCAFFWCSCYAKLVGQHRLSTSHCRISLPPPFCPSAISVCCTFPRYFSLFETPWCAPISVVERPTLSYICTGEDLCNTMFGDAFVYTEDEDQAFTMWWFEAGNPNDDTTQVFNNTVPKSCNVSYFHKENPSPEGENFTECHPYKENACCEDATVTTVETLNKVWMATMDPPLFHIFVTRVITPFP